MEIIKLFASKEDCCGCGACMNVCPEQAIAMKEDEYGFLFPEIDSNLCILCGACKKVCAYQNIKEVNSPIVTYAAVTNQTDIMQSASGGVFASLAASVIKEGGIVFGVSLEIFQGKLTPIHIPVRDLSELIKLQGSKYVQSNIEYTFRSVKKQLMSGRLVLFSGTPCQIAGLKSYLGKDYDNLLLVDLICHGVPSAKFFQDYIAELGKKLKGEVVAFRFRDKSKGWKLYGKAEYISQRGDLRLAAVYPNESSYYSLFLDSATYRESCYSCKYASKHRPGDITIGDYWRIEKEHPELLSTNGGIVDDRKGVSCLIVNTDKGSRYLNHYKAGILTWTSTFQKIAEGNGQLNKPSPMSAMRMTILNLYKKHNYEAVENWFVKQKGWKDFVRIFINRMPFGFKNSMKKLKTSLKRG